MWQWSSEQSKNIEAWKAQQLREVYFAIFRKYATDNFIKRDLRKFEGLQYTKQQKAEHSNTIAKELSVNALIRVCSFLRIEASFDNNEKLAEKVIDAISIESEKTSSKRSVCTVKSMQASKREELDILEQIQKVDEENAKIRAEICNKEKVLMELQLKGDLS